jgi:hypothetical protein
VSVGQGRGVSDFSSGVIDPRLTHKVNKTLPQLTKIGWGDSGDGTMRYQGCSR